MEKTITVAVVEDEESAALRMKEYLCRYEKEHSLKLHMTRFGNGEDFLSNYRSVFNIVFMDVMMPGINGIETAKKLREKDKDVILIFITNLAKFAVKGYEVSALDFIVKPVVYQTFEMKMTRALEAARKFAGEKISVYSQGSTMFLNVSDIYYIEVYNHDLFYYTAKGKIPSKGSLNPLEEQLKEYNFSRCSGGFLVNLQYVDGIKENMLYINGKEIPIGRSKKKEFMKELADYLGRNI